MFIAGNNLIVSQTMLNSNEPYYFKEYRSITYKNLNEALKYAKFKHKAEERDSIQKRQLAIKDSIIESQEIIIKRYESKILPNLQAKIESFENEIKKTKELYEIKDEKWKLKIDKIKSKRLGISVFAGGGYTSFGIQPILGAGISYTFFRF